MVSKKRVDKLDMQKILQQIGFPLTFEEIRATYKYNVDVETAMEFEKKIRQIKSNYTDIMKIICEYEDIFDKEIFVFHVARLLEKDIEELKRADMLGVPANQQVYNLDLTDKNKRRFLINAKELLKNIDSDVVDLRINASTGEIIIDSSQEFIGNKSVMDIKRDRSEERLKKIESTIGFGEIMNYLVPSDLINICKYPNLGNILAISLYKDKPQKQKGKKRKNRADKLIEDNELQKGKFFYKRELENIIRRYIEYIDIDKMLLLANALYYNKYGNDFYKFKNNDVIHLEKFTKEVGKLLEEKDVKIESSRIYTIIDFKTIKNSVDFLIKHFINGKFYEDNKINEIAKNIIYGNMLVSSVNKREFLDVFQFTTEEISILITNQPEALQYLVENKLLKKNELKEIINLKKNFSNEQVLYLISEKLIDYDEVFNLYEQGKITLENIKFVKENLKEKDITTLVSEDRLIELYFDTDKNNEFVKYRKLYKALKIDDTDIQEQKKIAIGILNKSIELMEEEKIYELYHMELLPLDTIIDFLGNSAVTKLYFSGKLKPNDAKRLYKNGIITDDMFKEVFQSKNLTYTEKLVLIFSTFSSDEKEDIETREKFIKEYIPKALITKREKINIDEENKEDLILFLNKNDLAPYDRWNLIGSLDSSYSQKYLSDGNIVFYLPNEGKYIIEKLYSPNQEITYGYATYILDEDVFNDIKDKIFQNESVKTTNLALMYKNHVKGIKKVIHTGWKYVIKSCKESSLWKCYSYILR